MIYVVGYSALGTSYGIFLHSTHESMPLKAPYVVSFVILTFGRRYTFEAVVLCAVLGRALPRCAGCLQYFEFLKC